MTLALLGVVGELVVAVDVKHIFQIRRAADTATRRVEQNLYAIDLDDSTVPGWDLGELFGLGQAPNVWVVVEAPIAGTVRRLGLRMTRAVTVRELPKTQNLPGGILTSRQGAVAAGFPASSISELEGYPSGVVLDISKLLTKLELDAGAKLAKRGPAREAAVPT